MTESEPKRLVLSSELFRHFNLEKWDSKAFGELLTQKWPNAIFLSYSQHVGRVGRWAGRTVTLTLSTGHRVEVCEPADWGRMPPKAQKRWIAVQTLREERRLFLHAFFAWLGTSRRRREAARNRVVSVLRRFSAVLGGRDSAKTEASWFAALFSSTSAESAVRGRIVRC